jgi:hypothetical protein
MSYSIWPLLKGMLQRVIYGLYGILGELDN